MKIAILQAVDHMLLVNRLNCKGSECMATETIIGSLSLFSFFWLMQGSCSLFCLIIRWLGWFCGLSFSDQ